MTKEFQEIIVEFNRETEEALTESAKTETEVNKVLLTIESANETIDELARTVESACKGVSHGNP